MVPSLSRRANLGRAYQGDSVTGISSPSFQYFTRLPTPPLSFNTLRTADEPAHLDIVFRSQRRRPEDHSSGPLQWSGCFFTPAVLVFREGCELPV
jgi:hypothetical protein